MNTTERLIIDWGEMPTYNTIMAVAAGVGLILVVLLSRDILRKPKDVTTDGYSMAFGVLGFILTTTGLHMTLTWPLAGVGDARFPFDNIIFGEMSLGFGALLIFASFFLWRRGAALLEGDDVEANVRKALKPISIFILGLGLGLIAIAIAGVWYQLFAAPPEEPISGLFADYPLFEAIFVSGLYALTGLGAILFPLALENRPKTRTVVGWAWGLAGLAFMLFGALNFFTHIGLIVNTM